MKLEDLDEYTREKYITYLSSIGLEPQISISLLITFLDSNSIFISISTIDGDDWLVEICGIPVGTYHSRQEAEIQGILEGLNYLNIS